VTLADKTVLSMLDERFVVGWRNIGRESYVGQSHGYSCGQSAVGTTNGAGGRNMQILVLTDDLVVLHALPGFWHPEDFAQELRFAEGLATLWADRNVTRDQKDHMYRLAQLAQARSHGQATRARSAWQSFDEHSERQRLTKEPRDTFVHGWLGPYTDEIIKSMEIKPLDILVHERMARRPFRRLADLDIEGLVDYGQHFYDNNRSVGEKGVTLRRPKVSAQP
jgi:hypothetical protein